jgi:hypothetical protein
MAGASSRQIRRFSFPLSRAKICSVSCKSIVSHCETEMMHPNPNPSNLAVSHTHFPNPNSRYDAATASPSNPATRTRIPTHFANTALPCPCLHNLISPILIPTTASPAAAPLLPLVHKRTRCTYLRPHHLELDHIHNTQQQSRLAVREEVPAGG